MENGLKLIYISLGTFMFILAITTLIFSQNAFNKYYATATKKAIDTQITLTKGGR